MKLLVFIAIVSASIYARDIDLGSGEKLRIKSINTKCGSAYLPKLMVKTLNKTSIENIQREIEVISICQEIKCYVNYNGISMSGNYMLYIDTYDNQKIKVSDRRYSKLEALEEAKILVSKGICKKIETRSALNRIRE